MMMMTMQNDGRVQRQQQKLNRFTWMFHFIPHVVKHIARQIVRCFVAFCVREPVIKQINVSCPVHLRVLLSVTWFGVNNNNWNWRLEMKGNQKRIISVVEIAICHSTDLIWLKTSYKKCAIGFFYPVEFQINHIESGREWNKRA